MLFVVSILRWGSSKCQDRMFILSSHVPFLALPNHKFHAHFSMITVVGLRRRKTVFGKEPTNLLTLRVAPVRQPGKNVHTDLRPSKKSYFHRGFEQVARRSNQRSGAMGRTDFQSDDVELPNGNVFLSGSDEVGIHQPHSSNRTANSSG